MTPNDTPLHLSHLHVIPTEPSPEELSLECAQLRCRRACVALTVHVTPWHWANCRYMSNPISPQETQITIALANALVAIGQRTDALHTKVTAFPRPAPVPSRYH